MGFCTGSVEFAAPHTFARTVAMKLRLLGLALLFGSVMPYPTALAAEDDPPAAVVVEETAEPITSEKTDATSGDEAAPAAEVDSTTETAVESETAAEPETTKEAATAENAGLEDLDKATQLKVTAENLPDLNVVVDKLDSAIEKGLDKENQAFADQLLLSALLQRATVLSAAVLDRPLVDPRRDPRWMQVRQFAVNDLASVLSLDDNVWEAHLLMGRLQALPLGDSKTAKRELTKVIDSPDAPVDDRARSLALRGALQTEEPKRGADFDAAIALIPDQPDYYRVRARVSLWAGPV